MREAKLFGDDNKTSRLINAWDVRKGIVSRNNNFVDPEYEFRVIYVNSAKNNGEPYFRLYYSHEEYCSWCDDRKSKYDHLKNMSHFDESEWHKRWSANFGTFAKIEKYIKDPESQCYKRADAFIEDLNLVIEFQHSFIASEFQSRNDFYKKLGINVLWLFDLEKQTIETKDDRVEILENNARGFFKIAEEVNNKFDIPVFMQVKNGYIYRVKELFRKDIDNKLKSTIRYFEKTNPLTEDEFINKIRDNSIFDEVSPMSLFEIWKQTNDGKRKAVIVENIETHKYQRFDKDEYGMISENYSDRCLGYTYYDFDTKTGKYFQKSFKFYSLKQTDAKKRIWILRKVKY